MFGGAAAVPNSYESISTVTVGSGGQSTITFSSIPSTYQHLQIRGITKNGSNAYILFRYNGDGNQNYTWHSASGDGSSTGTGAAGTGTFAGTPITQSQGGGTSIFSDVVIDVLNYTDTNKNKVMRSLSGFDDNGSGSIGLTSGMWLNTAAVTSITFALSAGSFSEFTQLALYGIKG
jgi:hypothetical protein